MTNSINALLIIPCFNEGKRMVGEELSIEFEKNSTIDFLLVDDGSTDATAQFLVELEQKHNNVTSLLLSKNVGKAEAIRNGLLANSGEKYAFIGYLDADLATPISEMVNILKFAKKNPNYRFLMGSRIKRLGSNINRYSYRHYIGRFFATIISGIILKTPIYDTQCGAKIIEYKLAQTLFEKPFLTRWLFDVELLLRMKQLNSDFYKEVYEYPLETWIEKGNSKIRLKDMLQLPFQLIKIHLAYV
ncbi:MAG: glycosyltransferase [Flavobacterium sp.]|nr:glycosyltransferase [Flavobacterium sp.]